MSYSNGNGYDYCNGCYKQKQFCTCPTSYSSDLVIPEEPCNQTFTEHNPSCQSIGEQEQQQKQEQGGLEQTQGPQTQGPQLQDQIQEGQRQGPQSQEQTQGPQTQGNQTEDQHQTQGSQVQAQTEDQDQTQGPQLQLQRHGDQTMTNNQTISTPIDVDGVTLNVKCGDCQPIIFPDFEFFKKRKNRKRCERGCHNMENCDCGQCNEDSCCNCCVRNLANLLNSVRQLQATATVSNPIDLFFSVSSTLSNPATGQIITNVVDCSTVSFRSPATAVPNTRVQLCDVAGFCVANTSPDVFQFLLDQINATAPVTEDDDCSKNQPCICPSCAEGIGQELMCAASFGLQVNIFIRGLVTNPTTPLPNYVLAVRDCLVFLGNAPINPTEICVFSLCAITGFTVPPQTIPAPTI